MTNYTPKEQFQAKMRQRKRRQLQKDLKKQQEEEQKKELPAKEPQALRTVADTPALPMAAQPVSAPPAHDHDHDHEHGQCNKKKGSFE
eukprot:CAMPEP_0194036928 /NCGR_PEP_ID=MMETSP0009_2-20130614/9308_1 /TAXON_ID=210454 /ORGANISM="Grammatophora oceanica, Strain CCMP 410" /LENGTH=87 /DNA_ID=CAMNT_0038678887 /DNA_START=172 /DNA_END=435 /DNA_ORIENTATION=+